MGEVEDVAEEERRSEVGGNEEGEAQVFGHGREAERAWDVGNGDRRPIPDCGESEAGAGRSAPGELEVGAGCRDEEGVAWGLLQG